MVKGLFCSLFRFVKGCTLLDPPFDDIQIGHGSVFLNFLYFACFFKTAEERYIKYLNVHHEHMCMDWRFSKDGSSYKNFEIVMAIFFSVPLGRRLVCCAVA